MAELKRTIDDLTTDYASLKAQNAAAEKALLQNFENAEKEFSAALETYDQDMRDKNKERDETEEDYKDQM